MKERVKMPYLSRVEVDVNNRQKIKDLTHLGAYHNWVEQSFPQEFKKDQRKRHLWRIDTLKQKEYLLVVSEDKPDLDKLEKYGVKNSAQTKDYGHFLAGISTNQIMRFRLTANPSYKKDGKRYPHITVKQQEKWLLDRTKKNGFAILQDSQGNYQFDITSRDWQILRHHNSQKVRMSRVSFEGVLQVTDSNKFKTTLLKGIGKEKAYGMGLITVIPID